MKNFPKKVDSKTRYLRIEIPENLDLVLEGLIRKVLREQPDMDNIYSFAAEYFETLIKIRDRAGIKHTSHQICPSSSDEDALQMIKLANTFQKPVTEKPLYSKKPKENKKLEKSERKVLKVIPNGKENLDKKSSNYKSKISNESPDLTTSNKKYNTDRGFIKKVKNENFPSESKEIDASDQVVSRNDEDNENVVENKEQIIKNGEEKNEAPMLKSAEISGNVKAKSNNRILNGILETSQVIEKSIDSAEKDNLKEKTENVVENKNNKIKEYENENQTEDCNENKEDKISNSEKNTGEEEKKEEKNKKSQVDEETLNSKKASESNKEGSEILEENKDIKETDKMQIKTSKEETNENEDKKSKRENSGKSMENKNSEVEEEKDVRKNNELNKYESLTLANDIETKNELTEQMTQNSKNAEQILQFELVLSKSENVLSQEKEDKLEKSDNKNENVIEEMDFLHKENKLNVAKSLTNEIKENVLTKNDELISNLSEEQDKFSLDEQRPLVEKLDTSASDKEIGFEEKEINKEESALKKSDKEEELISYSEKEKTDEENTESEMVEANEKKKMEDKNVEFLNFNKTDIAKGETDTDVKLSSKIEKVEKTNSDGLNLENKVNKNVEDDPEQNGKELIVGNETNNDIKPLSDAEVIDRADDKKDSDVNKKSFFKTLTDSLKEVDNVKLEVSEHSTLENSKEKVIFSTTEEQKSKKEEDIEVLNHSSEPEKNESNETNVIIKLENEKESMPNEENLNTEYHFQNIRENNDQKEEKEIGSHIHYDSSLNQNIEELDKVEKKEFEDEELCTVVDALILSELKDKEDNENKMSNNEKDNEQSKTLTERKIKTIETHYYDLLKVPETMAKEYRVHRTEELPQTLTNENENKFEVSKEEKVKKEMISEVLTEEKPEEYQPNVENKFFLFDSTQNLEEIHLHDVLKANQIFLNREKLFSSIEKIILQATDNENKEIGKDKGVVNERVEKRNVFEAGAVPLAPREEEELKNQDSQASKEAKEKKYDKSKSSTEESESNNYESNASISADSKSLDIDVPIISVDVKTVVEEQVKEECDEEEKVSAEMLEVATDSSAPEPAAKKLLRVDEIESDDIDTNNPAKVETKKLNRSSSQSLMNAEGFTKKKLLKKTSSMPTIRQESTDEEIWSTIEKELENAATKIQSKFRGYSTRKKLRREDAVQITTEEPSNSATFVEEVSDGGCQGTGEFHDSIVLSVHPR